jgi:hypothetical protein
MTLCELCSAQLDRSFGLTEGEIRAAEQALDAE